MQTQTTPEPEDRGRAPGPVRWDREERRWVWSRPEGPFGRKDRWGTIRAGCGFLSLLLLLAVVTIAIFKAVTTGHW